MLPTDRLVIFFENILTIPFLPARSATDFRSSTPVAISGSASTAASEILSFLAHPDTSSYQNRRSPIPTETTLVNRNVTSRNRSPVDPVKNPALPAVDPSKRQPSELNERSQLLGEARGTSSIEFATERNNQFLRSIDTRIPAPRSNCQTPNTAAASSWLESSFNQSQKNLLAS